MLHRIRRVEITRQEEEWREMKDKKWGNFCGQKFPQTLSKKFDWRIPQFPT